MWILLACAPPSEGDSASPASPLAPDVPPDPSAYDCRAETLPDRRTAIDFSCPTDLRCAERLVTGHRGMGGTLGVIAPENTVSAIRAAIAYGVDFVETDPRPTADGVLVNVHDTDVARTTDGVGEVDALTYAEIAAMHVDAGAYPGDFSCERIATLEEILIAARGRVHVLVDANKTDRVDLLVAAILATGTLDEAIFDTSSADKIAEALAIEPSLHTMIRVETEAELDEQLARFLDHPPVIVEIDASAAYLAPVVRAAGHRPFIDVFFTDAAVGYSGDVSLYGESYEEGMAVLESDRPELVLRHLGR